MPVFPNIYSCGETVGPCRKSVRRFCCGVRGCLKVDTMCGAVAPALDVDCFCFGFHWEKMFDVELRRGMLWYDGGVLHGKVRRWKKIYTVEPAAATLPRKLLVHQASLETCPTPPVVMVSFEAVFAGWLCRGLRPSALFASLTEYGALYRVVRTQQACGKLLMDVGYNPHETAYQCRRRFRTAPPQFRNAKEVLQELPTACVSFRIFLLQDLPQRFS